MIPQSPKTGNDQKFSSAALQFGDSPYSKLGAWGTKAALRPACKAGLISRCALLPTNQAYDLTTWCLSIKSWYTRMLLSATISMESKKPCNPERSTLAASSAGSPLVKRIILMAAGKIGKRFRHAIEYARRRVLEFGDHGSHFVEGASLRQPAGQFHIALLERPSEAAHSISVLLNILALGLVQDVPCIGAGVAEGLDQGEEALQGVLKKDVTLPQSIVGIHEQS